MTDERVVHKRVWCYPSAGSGGYLVLLCDGGSVGLAETSWRWSGVTCPACRERGDGADGR